MTLALVSRLSLTRGAARLKALGRSSWPRSMICTTFIIEGGNTLVLRSELLDVSVWREPDGERFNLRDTSLAAGTSPPCRWRPSLPAAFWGGGRIACGVQLAAGG